MNFNELFCLSGETAIVTGGTGHLGVAMAEGLSEAGANVVIAGRDENKCNQVAQSISDKTGNLCIGVEINITSRLSIRDGYKKVFNQLKDINILINNASYSASNNLKQMTDEEWTLGLEGTVNGVFMCMQEILTYLENTKSKNRAIINIASMYGLISPDPSIYGSTGFDNPPNYGAGKAAIIQLTKYSACHLAKDGIRVNCISPGAFPKPEVQQNRWFMQNLESKIPLTRIGRPDELKGAVVFLASSASSYVTGHNLIVDGGWTVW